MQGKRKIWIAAMFVFIGHFVHAFYVGSNVAITSFFENLNRYPLSGKRKIASTFSKSSDMR